jgi:protein-S-isoprenylcysteine O-methyltransferase Ste14
MSRRKALPPTYFWLSVLAMICLHYAYPIYRFLGYPYNLVGLVPMVFGLWVNMWCSAHFKRIGTTVKPFEEPDALVTRGPFKRSRHPMYVGMVAALVGLSVVLGTVTSLIVIPVFVWAVQRRFVIPEEHALERAFGDEYAQYKQQVRQWI